MTGYLTVAEAANLLHCSEWHTRRLMASGALGAAKVGRRWLTTQADVDAYYAGLRDSSPARRRRRRSA